MNYSLNENNQVVNDAGQVAMVHHDSNPCTFQDERDGHVFSFEPRDGVSMAWIDPQYVDFLLSVTVHACCGRTDKKFRLANLAQTCIWQDRKRC